MAEWEKKRTEEIEKALSEISDEPTQIDRIAEIRGWFRPPKDAISYPAVQEYMNDGADLQTTVDKITKPIDEALKQGSGKDQLGDVWYPIIHSAKRIPYSNADQHAKLVDLVKAIKEHPEPSQEHPTYKSLSGLGLAARESYNDIPRHHVGSVPQEIHAWTNFNYFLARLTDSGIWEAYLYVIWAMREALEKTPEPLPWWYDANVPAAAAWVLGLGKKVYEREEDLTPKDPNQGNPARGGDLWTGGPVFSKERWAFWKKRFGDVVKHEGVSDEAKGIAKQAVEAMEKAESA
ncbi:uncharacterized protein N0V89_003950 [Didymosphaeria variabile]|uniref:Uncharacterized protein n=1 Tax=Didymosphaeria variabile TaxID=1932322 RepID=A0A9W8XRI5_9PLEO|nr:uncharacterized protein N0V89_003950 [Didymosphaeria variabile]KAJ4355925.1 hypothetical protein N0V89_003950 [Didymosphaeria variabile]